MRFSAVKEAEELQSSGVNKAAAHPVARSKRGILARIWQQRWLYLLVAPAIVYFLVFCYVPMYGLIIAFKDYSPFVGFWESRWVGLEHFRQFFSSIYFWRLLRNTVLLNLYGLIFGFPIPIILALLLNEVGNSTFKRIVQTCSYMPYFVSTVVVAGMIVNFLSPTTGIVNNVLKALGFEPIPFLTRPEWFRPVYVASGIWQGAGWGSIIYLAALAGIDPSLYDAAKVDGANRLQRMRYVSIPGIMPTIMVLLLLNLGSMLSVGFEKVFLLYNPRTYETADVFSTYVYRAGLIGQQWGFGTAVGLFNSVANLILLALFNYLARKAGQQSLW
jgi:putative aldouronate transport system permease protein